MQKSQPRTPKRVQFLQGFTFGKFQITKWPSDKHKDLACRVHGDVIQLLDKRRGELAEVPTSAAVCVYEVEPPTDA